MIVIRLFNRGDKKFPTNKNDVEVEKLKNVLYMRLSLYLFLFLIVVAVLIASFVHLPVKAEINFSRYILIYGENQQSGFKNPERSAVDSMERYFINDRVRSP